MAEEVRARLWAYARSLKGVEERPSAYADLPALYVGRVEFLHSHSPYEVDLRLPPPLVAVEIAKGGARAHRSEDAARDGWVVVEFRAAGDLPGAKELVRLGHRGVAKLAGT